jgi:hypothetical protein
MNTKTRSAINTLGVVTIAIGSAELAAVKIGTGVTAPPAALTLQSSAGIAYLGELGMHAINGATYAIANALNSVPLAGFMYCEMIASGTFAVLLGVGFLYHANESRVDRFLGDLVRAAKREPKIDLDALGKMPFPRD